MCRMPPGQCAVNSGYHGLIGALAGVPVLRGARCRGRHHLFDPPACDEPDATAQARHSQALRVCEVCPALDACAAWVSSLPVSKRPHGVVAGRIITPRAERRTA